MTSARLLDAGVPVVGSSDHPVAISVPLHEIQVMVTRRTAQDTVIGAVEAMTVDEAMLAYTHSGAVAAHREAHVGNLSAGKLAGLTLLAEDPRRVAPDRVGSVDVIATMLAGAVTRSVGPRSTRGGLQEACKMPRTWSSCRWRKGNSVPH